ncbi:hypothetical protein ACLOJK_009097 [Asimina triloba]
MNGRVGGCCVARYAGGGYGASKMDRIMLRFRPIAPKPAAGVSVAPPAYNRGAAVDACPRRGKRRCGARRSNSGGVKKPRRALSSDESAKSVVEVVTLPLLPEKPDRKESPPSEEVSPLSPGDHSAQHVAVWLWGNSGAEVLPVPAAVVAPQPVRLVGSWVTVECVRETCEAGLVNLLEEEAMMKSLEKDACPGFVTDGWDRATWTNEAYKRMVGGELGEVVVVLQMKERVPSTCGAFSCLARVQYTCRKERNSTTVPCDAWRMMDGKRFAWRLDVNAALCLGR